MIKPTDEALWSAVFGSSFEVWDWWINIEYVEGEWDKPGHVRLTIENPDYVGTSRITANIRMDNIRKAFDELLRKGIVNRDCIYAEDDVDLDAVAGDAVLQQAILGDIIYG